MGLWKPSDECRLTSHYWAREIGRLGHDVRMMPPAYVKPYVKRGKTDASDAEAICEAVTRLSCCRFRGHEDKIVTKELECRYDETEVQP